MAANRSILVTGGAGFIGSNVVHRAVSKFDEVFVVDKLTYAGEKSKLEGCLDDIEFVEGDIRDRETLSPLYEKADYVVNLAAESHVDRSIESGDEFIQSNVEGAFAAMDLLREHDVEHFVQMSTDEVYGSIESGEFTESDPLDPSSPYSASKASADLFVNACWETYDLPISVLRPTNIFGPRQNREKLIPKFIDRALRGETLPLYGDGENVRQWLYVDDFCTALFDVLEEADNEIYNVAGPERRSNLEVTKAIIDRADASEDQIEFVEDRKGHDLRYAISDDKLRCEVGFEPEIGFEEGLDRTFEWFRNRDHDV